VNRSLLFHGQCEASSASLPHWCCPSSGSINRGVSAAVAVVNALAAAALKFFDLLTDSCVLTGGQ